MIREHEVGEDGRCKHCGALKPDPVENTCVERVEIVSGDRPEPARREYAIEAVDLIGARLAELRAERDAAMNEEGTLI